MNTSDTDRRAQAMLLMVKGVISEFDQETQQKVRQVADEIRRVIADAEEVGALALGLVAAERAAEIK